MNHVEVSKGNKLRDALVKTSKEIMLRKTKEKKTKEEMAAKRNSRLNEGETLHCRKKGHKVY